MESCYRKRFDPSTYETEMFRNGGGSLISRREISTILHFTQEIDGEILEVGVGTGRFLRSLAESHRSIVGVDIDQEMIHRLRDRVRDDKGMLGIDLIVADGETLPFRESVFGGVVCVRTLKYFRDPKKALANMCLILKTNGRIVLEFANLFGAETLTQIPIYIFERRFTTRLFTRKMIIEWLVGHRMSIDRTVTWHKLPPRIVTAVNNRVVLRGLSQFEGFLQKATPTDFLARSIVLSAVKTPQSS